MTATVLDLDDFREQRTRHRIRLKVEHETSEARARGHAWTEYRRFLDPLEGIGASLCCACVGRRSRRTARAARFVKYCTTRPGPLTGARVTKCEWCVEHLGPLRDGLTRGMIEALVSAHDCDGLPCAPIAGSTRAALARRGLVGPGRSLSQTGARARALLIAEQERRRRR